MAKGYDEVVLSEKLRDVDEYFSDEPGLCKVGKCKMVVKEGSEVVNVPPRQVPMHIRSVVEKEIERLVSVGIIVPCESEWSSPIIPVRKTDGSIWVCVDYKELNAITPLRRYWLPSLQEILGEVGNSRVISKLD